MERLKEQLGKSSGDMAELFSLANGRQWRRYLSTDPNNSRDMGMHMLFFAMARLELDPETLERILNRMREAGATIELDSE
ncbi:MULTISPECIES: XRE family transcriptional regulator [Burkholderia]|nr:XRE family transcriptional regulator [Burkholderia glumae]